jgi:hypothetical protein
VIQAQPTDLIQPQTGRTTLKSLSHKSASIITPIHIGRVVIVANLVQQSESINMT